jgi:hypothetical protein
MYRSLSPKLSERLLKVSRYSWRVNWGFIPFSSDKRLLARLGLNKSHPSEEDSGPQSLDGNHAVKLKREGRLIKEDNAERQVSELQVIAQVFEMR